MATTEKCPKCGEQISTAAGKNWQTSIIVGFSDNPPAGTTPSMLGSSTSAPVNCADCADAQDRTRNQ